MQTDMVMCLVHILQSCSEKLSLSLNLKEADYGDCVIRAKCPLFTDVFSASTLKQERRCQKLPGKTSRCCENVVLETWSAGLDFDETSGGVKIQNIMYQYVSMIINVSSLVTIIRIISVHGTRFIFMSGVVLY